MRRSLAEYAVLDALANDLESLESILRLANHPLVGWQEEHGREFVRDDIVAALRRLIRDHSVEAFAPTTDGSELATLGLGVLPPSPFDDHWFAMTVRGEPPRDCRRLPIVRGWEHDKTGAVFS